MLKFYGLLAGNIARSKVLLLAITRTRLIYRSADIYWALADIRAKLVYRIGYLLPIKYRISLLPLTDYFLELARALLHSMCLV